MCNYDYGYGIETGTDKQTKRESVKGGKKTDKQIKRK